MGSSLLDIIDVIVSGQLGGGTGNSWLVPFNGTITHKFFCVEVTQSNEERSTTVLLTTTTTTITARVTNLRESNK